MTSQLLRIGEEFVALRARDRSLGVDGAVRAQFAAGGKVARAVGAGVRRQPLSARVHQRHVAPVGRLVEMFVTPTNTNGEKAVREKKKKISTFLKVCQQSSTKKPKVFILN
jgi:hypothetical protein